MQTVSEARQMLALFNLGKMEVVLILALFLVLIGAKKLPELAMWLGRGIPRFRDGLDEEAFEAGRSAGGIYGKRAAQALTPDNQVAEMYDPAAFREKLQPSRRSKRTTRVFARLKRWLRKLVEK